MELAEFIAMHGPALEANAARHNLILGLLEVAKSKAEHNCALWSLDTPGACAIRTPQRGRGIVLGELTKAQCGALAEMTAATDYPSVTGQDDMPGWFAGAATALGARFHEGHAQRIHALSHPPVRPDVPGAARAATMDDRDVVFAWMTAFHDEATPEDPPVSAEYSDEMIQAGRRFLWEVGGIAVAMAGLGRRIKDCASIAPVYTLPELRARGFGGAVTSAVVDRIFAEGRRTACLYTDLSNPYSNRCYAKIGFEPVCDSWLIRRMVD